MEFYDGGEDTGSVRRYRVDLGDGSEKEVTGGKKESDKGTENDGEEVKEKEERSGEQEGIGRGSGEKKSKAGGWRVVMGGWACFWGKRAWRRSAMRLNPRRYHQSSSDRRAGVVPCRARRSDGLRLRGRALAHALRGLGLKGQRHWRHW